MATNPTAELTDVPRGAPLRIRFDRFLDPGSVIRQSVRVVGGTINPDGSSSAPDEFLEPTYDVLERVAIFRLSEGRFWAPNVRYTVTLFRPGERDGAGFRAWDGAPLNESITFSFTTVNDSNPKSEVTPPRVDYCSYRQEFDVPQADGTTLKQPCTILGGGSVLQQSCAYGTCHGNDIPGGPAQGLDLSSFSTMRTTALGQVAHQTLTGDTELAQANPARFGSAMPLIDPGQPGNSYVLYKILASPELWDRPGRGEPSELPVQDVGGEIRPSSDELARLQETFILGAPMPLNASMTLAQVRALQTWIARGAEGPPEPCVTVKPTCGEDNGSGGAGGSNPGVSYTAGPQAILQAKCAPCHTSGSSGELSYSGYADTQKASYFCAGKTKGACSLDRIKDGSMPQGGGCTGDPAQDASKGNCLTAEEQATLQSWVDGGQQP